MNNIQDQKESDEKRKGVPVNPGLMFTQVPNWCFDEVIPKLKTGASVRVLLLILRKTYGWHKEQDAISFSQFHKVGIVGRDTVVNAIKELEELNIIRVIRSGGGKTNVYSLIKDARITEKERQLDKKSSPEIILPEEGSPEIIPVTTPKIILPEAESTPKIIPTKETKELNKEENKKECAHAQITEVFSTSEDLVPHEKVFFTNGFSPPDSGKKVQYWEDIQKKIDSGKELNCNQVLSIFKKKYADAGLGDYAIFAKHRVKMKAALAELGTFKVLKIIDYYVKNFKIIHRRNRLSGKPNVDIMLSNWLNDFIADALGEKVDKGEALNDNVPDKYKDVMTWEGYA